MLITNVLTVQFNLNRSEVTLNITCKRINLIGRGTNLIENNLNYLEIIVNMIISRSVVQGNCNNEYQAYWLEVTVNMSNKIQLSSLVMQGITVTDLTI